MVRRTALFAILFLFFLQLLTEFVAAIYAFGLLGTSIPPEMAALLLLFSPLLLLLRRRPWPLRLLLTLFLLSRLALPFFSTRGRMLVAGVGVSLFLLWLPAWLAQRAESRPANLALSGGLALLLGSSASAFLRAAGGGIDITTAGNSEALAWLLAVLAALLLFRLPAEKRDREGAAVATAAQTIVLILGIFAIFTLVYFALSAPHVMARWAAVPLSFILGILALALPAWALLFVSPLRRQLRPRFLAFLTLLFVGTLTVTLWGQQPPFPAAPDQYPFFPAPSPPWQSPLLALTLALAPLLFLDFGLLLESLTDRRPGRRSLALAFALGSFFLLLLIFAQVFTTVYDYIPVVGPWFRDRFWLVVPFPGIVVALSLLLARRPAAETTDASAWALPLLALLLGGGTLPVAGLLAPQPPATAPPDRLRVLTYNIQQGYDAAGERAYQEQLAVLAAAAPDIVGLQESDTARIANGNDDLIAYFSGALDYYAYYGPTPVAGTFGIALLSRYPLLSPRTFYMYSGGEQTATISATVATATGACRLLVTHLGNGGPLLQLQQILTTVDPNDNVIVMGDFNFRPTTEQYAVATSALRDGWVSGRDPAGAPLFDPARRIDHIFVSPPVQVAQARYLPATASDHPPLLATVRCPE